MGSRGGRKVFHFYNSSGELENIVKFLEDVQKKVNYINLNCTVDGNFVKITIFGPRDIQSLATERLRELANRYLDS
ncbi:MAG: hypothetical protein EAX89_06070 [Candidatus Lokiarchaeota archaeon]|nr:hypothetical protein [Candidatus Lokiarchaeota archaeon]